MFIRNQLKYRYTCSEATTKTSDANFPSFLILANKFKIPPYDYCELTQRFASFFSRERSDIRWGCPFSWWYMAGNRFTWLPGGEYVWWTCYNCLYIRRNIKFICLVCIWANNLIMFTYRQRNFLKSVNIKSLFCLVARSKKKKEEIKMLPLLMGCLLGGCLLEIWHQPLSRRLVEKWQMLCFYICKVSDKRYV
jgi:hypothetical protein